MAFLMSIAARTNVHGPASYLMNTGFTLGGFPCMGAWIGYGLGSLGDNLPTFKAKEDHVLGGAENVLPAIGEQLGPFAERALRKRARHSAAIRGAGLACGRPAPARDRRLGGGGPPGCVRGDVPGASSHASGLRLLPEPLLSRVALPQAPSA